MTDTYDRRVQLGASRRRLEDAQVLHQQERWSGAMYLGGYAIECSLKSLICYEEGPKINNFKDTWMFKKGLKGSDLHNLPKLLECVESLKRAIELDRSNTYKEAWKTILSWRNDELRYSDKLGNEAESIRFIKAVEQLHRFILSKQGEAS